MWITEAANGFGLTIETTAHLYHHVSEFQTIDIYDTVKTGRVLLLDGIIQLTGFDEFAYQEMMAHVPLFAHPSPEKVLVIGGGDGGVLREIARHSCVKSMDICEIDKAVIDASKKFLPELSCGFDDPRVTVYIADGSKFIAERPASYDVIIVDSTDPGGPGAPLFSSEFYCNMKKALRPGGVIATQAESIYLLPDVVKQLCSATRQNFRHCGYGTILVPTYPTGIIGVCCASDEYDITRPARKPDKATAAGLRYYTPEIHTASFGVPKFALELVNP